LHPNYVQDTGENDEYKSLFLKKFSGSEGSGYKLGITVFWDKSTNRRKHWKVFVTVNMKLVLAICIENVSLIYFWHFWLKTVKFYKVISLYLSHYVVFMKALFSSNLIQSFFILTLCFIWHLFRNAVWDRECMFLTNNYSVSPAPYIDHFLFSHRLVIIAYYTSFSHILEFVSKVLLLSSYLSTCWYTVFITDIFNIF